MIKAATKDKVLTITPIKTSNTEIVKEIMIKETVRVENGRCFFVCDVLYAFELFNSFRDGVSNTVEKISSKVVMIPKTNPSIL